MLKYPLLQVIKAHGLHALGYSDDTHVYGSCKPSDSRLCASTCCNASTASPNGRHFRHWQCFDRASGEGAVVGYALDSDLSMNSHVSRTVGACFYQLRRLQSIRRSLPISATRTLVNASVYSRCDNHNGLFAGVTSKQIDRLQRILSAAKLIYRGGGEGWLRSDHVTPLLRKLH